MKSLFQTLQQKFRLAKHQMASNKERRRLFNWRTGAVLFASATVLSTALGAMTASSAQAQTRSYTPRFKVQARGRTTMFGNAVTTCSTTIAGSSGQPSCATARNATVTPATANNFYFMEYIDIDGDGSTFNSSSSTYTFPTAHAGFNIVWAGLYWAGDTGAGSFGGSVAPNAALRNRMSLKVPGVSGYQTITASQVDTSGNRYSAFADVTTLVKQGSATGEYFGANIQTGTGSDRYGGWVLIVAYADDTEVMRNMTIFDGYQAVSGTSQTATISGFLTPESGPFEAAMGTFTSEGDVFYQPDQFLINGQVVSDTTNPASNFFSSSNSLYGVGITTNTTVTTPGGQTLGPISRNPDYANLMALDIDIVEAKNTSGNAIIPNGATSANLEFTSTGDVYYPTAFFFSVQVYQPVLDQNFTKTVTDVNGGDVLPGDILEYTITYQNTGNDSATDVVLTDPIPTNTTYEPNSLRVVTDPDPLLTTPATPTDALNDDRAEFNSASNRVVFRSGIGANVTNGGVVPFDDPNVPGAINDSVSVKFRVRANSSIASFPTPISNQAAINYKGAFSGRAFTGVSDNPATTTISDPTIVQVVQPASLDFGDAPATYGDASHTITSLYLGSGAPDGEANTQLGGDAGAGADGDDGTGTDDENGVTFSPSLSFPNTVHVVQAGVSNTVNVVASAAGTLNAWIDYNQDGDFNDSGEQIFTNRALSAGNNALTFSPANTLLHGPTYARFRVSSQTGLGPTGTSSSGEVEDYQVNVAAPVSNAAACATTGLTDGSFEQLDITQSTPAPRLSFGTTPALARVYAETLVPGWNFAGDSIPPKDEIEIWRSQHDGGQPLFDAFAGNQHAEINADENGTLFQDVVTTPGVTMGWQFAHRGRTGLDTVSFKLSAPGTTVSPTNYTTGNNVNDPNQGWRLYSGSYTVPANQYITRVAFRAVSTATGDIRAGNFLDAVAFTLPPCVPPFKPNVLLVKRITKLNGGTTTNGGDNLAAYKQENAYAYDDNTPESVTPPDTDRWPGTVGQASSTFLIGGINGGNTQPKDEIEYTIYFLSTGNIDSTDTQVCDRVPNAQTFVLDAFNSSSPAPGGGSGANRGILVEYNGSTFSYTNDNDGDTAQFFPPGATLPAACRNVPNQSEDNGAVVVNLGTAPNANNPGTPANSYGLIRFRAKVK